MRQQGLRAHWRKRFRVTTGSKHGLPTSPNVLAQRFEGSISRKGNCYDNALAESSFATPSKELVHRERFRTRADVRVRLFEYIELFYKPKRRHSTLGNGSRIEFEKITISA
jgi:putative transposase